MKGSYESKVYSTHPPDVSVWIKCRVYANLATPANFYIIVARNGSPTRERYSRLGAPDTPRLTSGSTYAARGVAQTAGLLSDRCAGPRFMYARPHV